MKPVNTQIMSNQDLVRYNKLVKLNKKIGDTYFFVNSISVLTSVFQKSVAPIGVRQ